MSEFELPDFVKSKAFWEAATTVVSGLLALLAFFHKVDPSWAVPGAVILAWVFGLLRMFGIVPELRQRMLERQLAKAERLALEAAAARNDLLDLKKREASKPAVTTKRK